MEAPDWAWAARVTNAIQILASHHLHPAVTRLVVSIVVMLPTEILRGPQWARWAVLLKPALVKLNVGTCGSAPIVSNLHH